MKKAYLDFLPSKLFPRIFSDFIFLASFIFCFVRKNENIWLLGENRGEPVGDNGVWFYKYCRDNLLDVDVYIVVNRGSHFFREFYGDRRLVIYGSWRHAFIFHSAGVFLYTHTIRDVCHKEIYSVFGGGRYKVFLHHGVLGFKRFNKKYYSNKNMMDIFTVGSERELLIARDIIGVSPERLKVTGYARYDNLFRGDVDSGPRRIISYMPTHRNYLDGKLMSSELGAVITELLLSERLVKILEDNDCYFKFYPHKELDREVGGFTSSSKRVEVNRVGQFGVADVLKKSSLLITDYSSVSWDFHYLNKPIIFMHLDAELYERDRGGYIDIMECGIGPVFYSVDDMLDEVELLAKRDFKISAEYSRFDGANSLLGVVGGCCERIYKVIQDGLKQV